MPSLEYLRSFRFGPFTFFDTALAYIGVLLLSPLLTKLAAKAHLKIPTSSWLWFTLPISVIFHFIFRQDTPLMKILANPSQFQFYIALLVLIAMTYMGARKVSKIKKSE